MTAAIDPAGAFPPPAPHAALRTPGRATASLVLGIIALATGFLAVPLAGAIVANVLGSQAVQEIDASAGALGGRGVAVAGMVCASAAMVLWGLVFAGVLIAGEGS